MTEAHSQLGVLRHPIGYTPGAYRAYLKMSHRDHLLVMDAREKMTAVLGLEEIAGEAEQEIDIDIDSAEFLLSDTEFSSNIDIVEHIYAEIDARSSATNLLRFEDFTRNWFPETQSGADNGDNSLESRIQRSFRQLHNNGALLGKQTAIHYYLLRHHDLIEMLPEVVDICRKQLDQTQISVELYEDPEVIDSYLAIYARQEDYHEDFLSMIQSAREKYSHLLVNSSGWIHLTTDFDAPR